MPLLRSSLRLLPSLLAATALLACGTLPPPRPLAGLIPHYAEGDHFDVVSDLQRTSHLEFWRESNDPERSILVRAIAADRPAFLAITGDLVFSGSSPPQWAFFDALMTPIREAGIPAVAAFGNHEYWSGRGGENFLFARFPDLERHHFYARAWGPLRLVILDSNVDELPDAEWLAQKTWYEETLARFDGDPEVRGVLVLMHHPAFTNSTVTSDEPHVARDFVPSFLRAQKTLAMICGHVHSYERFARGEKMFVVSGGGGGPRARLASGSDRRHPDDLFEGPSPRDFEFLRVAGERDGLRVEVRGLPKGGAAVRPIDGFFLPYREGARPL